MTVLVECRAPGGPYSACVPPGEADPALLAAEVVQLWGGEFGTCAEHAASLGWVVRVDVLAAARGGLRALLLPRAAGGFSIVADPDPAPGETGLTVWQVVEWRVAHEYCHSLFYVHGARSRRATAPTGAEEALCDGFATAVTGVRTRSSTPSRYGP